VSQPCHGRVTHSQTEWIREDTTSCRFRTVERVGYEVNLIPNSCSTN
jgi:hypothetical protein